MSPCSFDAVGMCTRLRINKVIGMIDVFVDVAVPTKINIHLPYVCDDQGPWSNILLDDPLEGGFTEYISNKAGRVHVQSEPEECLLQHSSRPRASTISCLSLERDNLNVHETLLRPEPGP